jgi:hypothetical protein
MAAEHQFAELGIDVFCLATRQRRWRRAGHRPAAALAANQAATLTVNTGVPGSHADFPWGASF